MVKPILAERDAAAAVALLLKVNDPALPEPLRREFASILPSLGLIALPLLTEEQIPKIFNQFIVAWLDGDLEQLLERLTIVFESVPVKQRSALKTMLLNGVKANNTSLTEAPVVSGGQTRVPTVGNWTQLLLTMNVDAEQFIAGLPNAAAFTAEDRQRIKDLSEMLRLLQSSSASVEGIEEEIPVKRASGQLGVLAHGEIKPVSAPPRSASPAGPVAATPHFTPEDEQEILAHAKKLSAMDLTPSTVEDLALILIDQIAQRLGLIFSDEALQRRFRTALIAQLKGIRPARETKSLLMRDAKLGGLGLAEDRADAVLAEIETAAKRFHDAEGVAGLERERARLLQQSAAAPTPPPAPSQPLKPVAAMADVPSPRLRPSAAPAPITATKTLRPGPVRMVQPRPFTSDRQQLQDIRPGSRTRQTVGPVDELRGLTVQEFRQIGANTSTSILKLKDKFDALAKESYALRVQGIVGWRQSPLHYLYLTMGNESMNERQPITAVVASRAGRGEETLTVDEFRAIADLNRALRF